MVYFKVRNFYKSQVDLKLLDVETIDSLKEYDGEYNYQLINDYFENIWFYSDTDINLIVFQIFCTNCGQFRFSGLYKNSEIIQNYYDQKYQIQFFFDLADEEQRKKYHSIDLVKLLSMDDFLQIILPNLQIPLLYQIDIESLDNQHNYIFHNWDFYELLEEKGKSNILLKEIASVSVRNCTNNESYELSSYNKDKKEAELLAFNVLLSTANLCINYATPRGLLFTNSITLNSNILSKHRFSHKMLIPKIRCLEELGSFDKLKQDGILQEDLNACMDLMINQNIRPFEIISKS